MNWQSRAILAAWVLLGLGCPTSGTKPATVDLNQSLVSVDRATGVKADGVDKTTVSVLVVDTTGHPVPGQLVQINASGSGNTVSSAPVTDASGKTSATLASTVAETKTVTVQVSAGPLTQHATVAFVQVIGGAATLALGSQPNNAQSGAVLAPAPHVSILDASGTVITTSTLSVTVSLVGGTAGATLSGTTTVPAVNGVAAFTDLSVDKTGTAYKLSFAATGVTGIQSQPFNITPGSSSKLAFQVQPSDTPAGTTFNPAVQVVVQDASGNVVPNANIPVTVALLPAGTTLGGTTTIVASSGSATFSDLTINRAATGYTLVAQSVGYVSAMSSRFNVTPGAAAKLAFGPQPSNVVSAAHIAPAVVVSVQDSLGNAVTSYTAAVTVALTTPAGALLSGTPTQNAVAGAASFADLSVDKVGSYTLTASSGALPTAASTSFTVSPGAVSKLGFLQQPTDSTANAALSPAVKVALQDAAGNSVPGALSVTVAIGTNAGGAALSGTLTQPAPTGVATFSNLALDKVGTGYTLSFSATGVSALASATFNIAPGSGSKLVFTQQASDVVSGASIVPAVLVTVEDASNNVVTTSTAPISLSIANNAGGGTLGGTTTQNAVAGVATFPNLTVDKAGIGYTLSASSPTIASITGNPFNVSPGTASQLVFTQQPVGANNGATLPPIAITFEDAAGNVVTSSNSQVTLAIGTNPGAGVLSGTTQVNAVSGVASYSGLSIDKTGNGYTLTASGGGLLGTSAPFNITPGLITGTDILHFIADQGLTAVPVDMSPVAIAAYVLDAGTFQKFGGSGDAGGAFSIAGVPTTTYYLQNGTDYIVGGARAVDLGSYVGGRADVQFAAPATGDAGTYVALSLKGLNPWGQFDTLEVFSSNAGLWAQNIQGASLAVDGGPPNLGDSQLVETENYSLYSAPSAVPLVDASKSDQTVFWQLATKTPTGGTAGLLYLAASSAFETLNLTATPGQTATLAGTMTAVPQSSSLPISWNLPAFESQVTKTNPGAHFNQHALFLDAIPTAGHGFYVSTPDLITMGVGQAGLATQNLGLSYGDIFPSWTKFGEALMQSLITYSVAGINGTVQVASNVIDSDNVQTFPFSAIQPQLSPVQTPLIGGQNAFNTINGVGVTPTLAWTAPSIGTPNGYVVQIDDLVADASGNLTGFFVARIFTTATSVVVPPGIFLTGHHYIFQITAVSFHGLNVASAPYQSDFPQNSADCFTGVMTP